MIPKSVDEIEWSAWVPRDVATLLFIRAGAEVLLIRKLRGLGAGKINGPGGRLEPGETPLQAAVRETIEEVGVEPIDPVHRGELRFQFVDGYSLHAHLFVADRYDGDPISTDEAIPMWLPIGALPFGEMWADDALWLPQVLADHNVDGVFIFDDDVMVDHRLTVSDAPGPSGLTA